MQQNNNNNNAAANFGMLGHQFYSLIYLGSQDNQLILYFGDMNLVVFLAELLNECLCPSIVY